MATPKDYNIPYQDLELVAQDGVKLRCYMMIQKRSLSELGAEQMVVPEDMSDETVRLFILLSCRC